MNTTGILPSNTEYIAQVNTLGHAVLIETLKMAAYYIGHSNGISSRNYKNIMNEARSCYLYVQGTGLEVTLNKFGLNYDPNRIKFLFNYLVRHSI